MAMPNAPATLGAHPTPASDPSTLRTLLDARRREGRRFAVQEAIAVIVPVLLDLQKRHGRGEKILVHPSAIAPGVDGLARVDPRLGNLRPSHPLDRVCIAPELQRTLEPGDACASVYSVGAILYEMVTGSHVGPAMKRPRELDPSLPESLEVLIGKAIIGDRHHRPADLGALASAMYHVAPQRSIHPPEISEDRLDASAELAVDVRFSMLPPGEAEGRPLEGSGITSMPDPGRLPRFDASDPYAAPLVDRSPISGSGPARRPADDPTAKLAVLKARLESDPRPRYVVNKERMDHGPFTAVELLQQLASHAFTGNDGLRDEISGQQMPVAEWEEFAPFAEQSSLVREKRAEQKAVVRAVDADKKSGLAKSIVAASVVVALLGVLAVWFFTRRGTRDERVVVTKDRAGTIEVNGDIKGKKRPATAAGGGGHPGAGFSGGQSYETVLNGNNEQISMGSAAGAPDLTNAQLSAPLRHASFIVGCGAPDDMKVTVRVAVRMGVPIGVTVGTQPPSAAIAACVDRAVRGLRWTPSPKTDFVTTSY